MNRQSWVPLTVESQAMLDEAHARLWCPDCDHQWARHTSGGMCDGGGTECWCVRFPPTGLERPHIPGTDYYDGRDGSLEDDE